MSELLHKHADELRDMWQSRALRESKGTFQRVLLAVFAEAYPTALETLLMVTFKGFTDISRPFLRGYAEITPAGWVVCDQIDRDGAVRRTAIYENEARLLWDARKLADKLKLSDKDRTELFDLLRKWIAADRRVGPHGERLAS